ncbi:hypothetical protein [Desulfolithobacter sp.]
MAKNNAITALAGLNTIIKLMSEAESESSLTALYAERLPLQGVDPLKLLDRQIAALQRFRGLVAGRMADKSNQDIVS